MGQAISATQFFLYGKRHFTKTGYLRHIKAYDDAVQDSPLANTDGVDLSGKTIAITGANSGIGKQIALYAAAKQARVLMLCRNPNKAETALEEIKSLSKNSNIQVYQVDVSELSQIRRVVKDMNEKNESIDVLVCNAGALLDKQKNSSEGLEVTFASHLLGGTYLLGELVKTDHPNVRTIVVTSGGMYNTGLPDWRVLTAQPHKDFTYDGTMAYAYAKRGQVLLVEEWVKHGWRNVVSAHPGWSATEGVDTALADTKQYLEPMRTEWQGAEGICWLLHTEKLQDGEFYLDRETQTKHLGGAFFREGSYTKNSQKQVDEFMAKLKEAAGL